VKRGRGQSLLPYERGGREGWSKIALGVLAEQEESSKREGVCFWE